MWKTYFWKSISVSALLLIVLTLVSFLGHWWWVFDLATSFHLQYFLLLTFLAMIFFRKRSKKALLVGFFAAVNFILIVPFYFGEGISHSDGTSYRAVSMNLFKNNIQFAKGEQAIVDMNPDILVLLELNTVWYKNLHKTLGTYPYSKTVLQEDGFGIGFYSRYPIKNLQVFNIGPKLYKVPMMVAQVKLEKNWVTVAGVHVYSPSGRKWAGNRNKQLQDLAKILNSYPSPTLVLGDLNTTPWSFHYKNLLRRSGLRDTQVGLGLQPTWPAPFRPLLIPIDHFLVSTEVLVHGRKVGPDIGSDHFPISIDFSIQTHLTDSSAEISFWSGKIQPNKSTSQYRKFRASLKI